MSWLNEVFDNCCRETVISHVEFRHFDVQLIHPDLLHLLNLRLAQIPPFLLKGISRELYHLNVKICFKCKLQKIEDCVVIFQG